MILIRCNLQLLTGQDIILRQPAMRDVPDRSYPEAAYTDRIAGRESQFCPGTSRCSPLGISPSLYVPDLPPFSSQILCPFKIHQHASLHVLYPSSLPALLQQCPPSPSSMQRRQLCSSRDRNRHGHYPGLHCPPIRLLYLSNDHHHTRSKICALQNSLVQFHKSLI